jgi:hypothetical protein
MPVTINKAAEKPSHPAYQTGVLNPEVHARLVADIDRIALDAGIPKRWIWTPVADVLEDHEVEWLRTFRRQEKAGRAYIGLSFTPDLETRMAAMAGALVRNFIRARVMTANQVIDALADKAMPHLTCLLIPNLYAESGQPQWRVNLLHDLLIDRRNRELQTVVGVTSVKDLERDYGASMASFIKSHYTPVKG